MMRDDENKVSQRGNTKVQAELRVVEEEKIVDVWRGL